MIYRIIATIVLVICIVAVGVALEPDATRSRTASPSVSSPDDGAMKSLRIN